MIETGPDRTVSASDVEKYGYCPLSWWLSEQNESEKAENLKRGIHNHVQIGKDVKNIKVKEKRSEESERSVIWFSLIAIIIGINGVAIVYTIYSPSQQGETIMILLSIIAAIWVFVAAFFFYWGTKMERETKRTTMAISSQRAISTKYKPDSSTDSEIVIKKRVKEAKWSTLLFFMVSGILALNALFILFSIGETNVEFISSIFLFLSLIWLFGSSFFYYNSLKREIVSKEKKQDEKAIVKPSFSDSEISIVLFAIVATVLASNSLAIYQSPHTNIGMIILIMAVLWLYGGFIFLYRAIRADVKLKLLINRLFRPVDSIRGKIATRVKLSREIEVEKLNYEQIVIWFAAISMVLAINAILMNFTRSLEEEIYGTLIAHIFEVVALLWLIGAFFFLYRVMLHSLTASKLRTEHGISEGKIDYVDALDGQSEMLRSEKYGLRGRPDYILDKKGELIPVEVKTGRIPRGPLFSHIIQLAAYCLLLEEKNNRTPPYGIIKYGDTQHKIEYTKELRDILINKLDEMKKIMVTGEAHRNHRRENKCRGCSRREICPERLA
ncbi:MAG: CRISPR-associated protein Cas4 [Thermoplasmata archaeon]|nr:MAG: CRISPR-associated protein Cas4 [Thermoplasmata archaeon]